jgi:FtsH-binding integral membrane protein
MQMVISAISVLVFTGLTAYDTQTIKEIYYDADDMETAGKKAVFGAFQLYIDFINIFVALLQLFGDRK